MPRRIANALTLLSAVVCVLSAMLVGRSFFRADHVAVPMGQNNKAGMFTLDGKLLVWHVRWYGVFRYSSQRATESRSFFDAIWRNLRGIPSLGIGWGSRGIERFLILPLWLVPLLTAIAPVRWWRRRRREPGRGFPVAGA